uniref:Transposase n=1 Tax=Meloidogyne javanica TaxID=6303 RepID=A0A915MAQ4_MELJA
MPKGTDCNPLENAWGQLARKVYENGRQFENVQQLKEAIRVAWDQIQLTELIELHVIALRRYGRAPTWAVPE